MLRIYYSNNKLCSLQFFLLDLTKDSIIYYLSFTQIRCFLSFDLLVSLI